MKLLTHSEIEKLIEDAFQAGYEAGCNSRESIHVQSSLDYVNKALKEIGEPKLSEVQR